MHDKNNQKIFNNKITNAADMATYNQIKHYDGARQQYFIINRERMLNINYFIFLNATTEKYIENF